MCVSFICKCIALHCNCIAQSNFVLLLFPLKLPYGFYGEHWLSMLRTSELINFGKKIVIKYEVQYLIRDYLKAYAYIVIASVSFQFLT